MQRVVLALIFWFVVLGAQADGGLSRVDVTADVPYKTVDQTVLKLDIYKPQKPSVTPLPVVVYLHGDGWSSGDKFNIRERYKGAMLNGLLKNGYAVVSVDYRLPSNQVHFPAPIEDSKDAVRWLRKHGAEYHLDTQRIGVWGSSTGAHLALLLAYSSDADFVGDAGLSGYSAQVSWVLDHFGPLDLNTLFHTEISSFKLWLLKVFSHQRYHLRKSSLLAFFGTTNPAQTVELCGQYSPLFYVPVHPVPTLIFHGDADETVPLEQSEQLDALLEQAHVPHDLVVYPDATHGFPVLSPEDTEKMIDKSLEFIRQHNQPQAQAHIGLTTFAASSWVLRWLY
jgi:acetyl esterase/lipase